MGLSLSCPGDDYEDIYDNFEALFVKSINVNGDEKTTLRSFSFNGQDAEPAVLKSFGSGKMIIEGSLSFRARESDPFHLETTISIKTPRLARECSRLTSFKDCEVSSPHSRSDSPVKGIHCTGANLPKYNAAVKLQKVYKSFRTRRRLADCAVIVEQQWWKLLDFAALKRSSISFFDIGKTETAVSRWSRARTRAAKVGKGLSKDDKARKLALQHWLEAIDPRHRYGHNLHFYYDNWLRCDSRQPFFYWLDVGDGRECTLEQCPRSKLYQQCIKYLGPKEREEYEVIVENGQFLYRNSRQLLDTSEGTNDVKWIFVLSTSKTLYVGQKKKGTFQHSSFLAGGATSAAGRLVVEKGFLKAVWPHSGHYRPTEENFQEFVSFLKENNVDMTDVQKSPTDEEEGNTQFGHRLDSTKQPLTIEVNEASNNSSTEQKSSLKLSRKKSVTITIPKREVLFEQSVESQSLPVAPQEEPFTPQEYMSPKWNLFEDDEDEDEEVPEESILHRIHAKKGTKSYQLGEQLSCKWTTGAGPRIGCVRDYPTQLQYRALEDMDLSPRSSRHARTNCSTPHNIVITNPRLFYSPRNMIMMQSRASPRILLSPSPLSLSEGSSIRLFPPQLLDPRLDQRGTL